jgi:hypothetical protein
MVLQLFYEWPVYSKFWFAMSVLLLVGLAVAAYLYAMWRTRKDRLWLKFVGRCLQQGMTYPEIESLKPLYSDMYSIGKGKVVLNPVLFRPHLLRYLSEHQKDQKEVRRNVMIFRKLAFVKHTDELLESKELDFMEPVSMETLDGDRACFCQMEKVLEDSLQLRVKGRLLPEFTAGTPVRLFFYRPASGGFLLGAKIESIFEQTVTLHTNFQFVHAEERHFMADLSMKASLCINMVPLIRLKSLPSREKMEPAKDEPIRWKHLDPQLGQFPASTVRISDRGIVLYIDETKSPRIDKNFLNQAYHIKIDFIDGQPLEAIGHLLGMGRRGYYLFRFGELLPEDRARINKAIRENHPQKERLA